MPDELADIVAMYRTPKHDPLALGDAFLEYRLKFGVSQQEMARRSGITAGTIHHHESVVRDPTIREHVAKGQLTFKEGRAFADINRDFRLPELIDLFVSGRLSSVHVERVVYNARRNPQMNVYDIVVASVRDRKMLARFMVHNGRVKLPRMTVKPDEVERASLSLAGWLDGLRLIEVPEYQRLKLGSALALLAGRVTDTVAWLKGKPLPGQTSLLT